MPDIAFGSKQDRSITAGCVLGRRAHLAPVHWISAGVIVEHREHSGRVVGAFSYSVVRRVVDEPAELLGIFGVAVLNCPGWPELRGGVSDHVEKWCDANYRVEKFGPLGHGRAHKQPTI